jgi:ABC-type Na+ efflux pump permease subunit
LNLVELAIFSIVYISVLAKRELRRSISRENSKNEAGDETSNENDIESGGDTLPSVSIDMDAEIINVMNSENSSPSSRSHATNSNLTGEIHILEENESMNADEDQDLLVGDSRRRGRPARAAATSSGAAHSRSWSGSRRRQGQGQQGQEESLLEIDDVDEERLLTREEDAWIRNVVLMQLASFLFLFTLIVFYT